MSQVKLIKVDKVDEELIQEIVKRIVDAVNPLKIILFGSWAYGNPRKGSDLDILVIVDKLQSTKRAERIKIRRLLQDMLISQDIIVVTTKDVEEWKNVPQAFITSIIRKGRVLYERKD